MIVEAILYVHDLERMAVFYERCFGLERGDAGDGHCGLRSDGWRLWLVQSDDAAPSGRRSQVPVKLAFQVASAESARALIEELGGELNARSWSFAGFERRDGTDP